jgi:hypothetical protein
MFLSLLGLKPTGMAMLPYQRCVSNKISRLLNKYNIKTVHIPDKKNMHLLKPAKLKLGLRVAGTPCEYGEVGPSRPGARNT